MSSRYLAYGLSIACEFDLPELAPAPPGNDADVRISLAKLPPPHGAGLMQQGADTFLRTRGVAYFRLRGGREIAIDPAPGATEPEVRLYLLGSAFGALLYQRGLLPLHAGAVAFGGEAAAIAGPSGIGKSTLVAHLARQGHAVLCDDTCAVSFDAAGRAIASPGLPRVKLCEDALAALAYREPDLAFDGAKYALSLPQLSGALPLTRVYLLRDGPPGSRICIERLAGFAATQALVANLYRTQYVGAMGLTRQVFSLVTALARSATIFTLTRPRGLEALGEVSFSIEAHLADAASGALA
ncbi:MAG TPA: hypothetical protein VHW60_11570 [Caulobacteraceae bacterium]|jgi:hypothetical protein|nr:hypothetical protein [Caulobacteraceae bacterium]